jgi:hypothetical protein
MMKHPAEIRIVGMGTGLDCPDGACLSYIKAIAEGDDNFGARIAISDSSHMPVAFACRKPDPSFWSNVDLLDVFAAPDHQHEIPHLIEVLGLRKDRKTICYTDDVWNEKGALLRDSGFKPEASLPAHFRTPAGKIHSLTLWSRIG